MNRRGFLATILAAATAPALVRYGSLMRPRAIASIAGPEAFLDLLRPKTIINTLGLRGVRAIYHDNFIDVPNILSTTKELIHGLYLPPRIELDCMVPMRLDSDKHLHIDGIKVEEAVITERSWTINEHARAKIIVPYDKSFTLDPKTSKLTWE